MSYILEALRKAERQRDIGRVPGLDSEHESQGSGGRRWWPWLALLAFNVAFLLTLTVWWYQRNVPEPPPPADSTEQRLTPPNPESRPYQESRFEEQNSEEAVVQAVRPRIDAAGTAPRDPPQPEPIVKSPPVAEPMTPPPPAADLPIWPQVSGALFQRVNASLRLDVHVYSDQPAGRFVLINLRKYHEGDVLQEGPALQEITPEGVVLSSEGERFRLQRE